MSLNEVGDLVKMKLREEYPDTWVRPEVHSPDQREGDVASIGLFPNAAYAARKKTPQIQRKAKAASALKETEAPKKADAATAAVQMEPQLPQAPHPEASGQPKAPSKKYLLLIAAVLALGAGIFLWSGLGRQLLGSLWTKPWSAPQLQLVLQVQVQDAVKDDADRVIGTLGYDLQKAQIPFASVDRNNPSTVEQADTIRIDLKGVPVARQGDLQGLVSGKYPGWTLMRVAETDYALTWAAADLAAMKRDTFERALATIQNRLQELGATGRAYKRPGSGRADYEIVVQLWGRPDELERVRQVLIVRGRLEIALVVEGPFVSQENALAKYGGVLPLNNRLASAAARGGDQGETWYVLNRTPVITGHDLRSARATKDDSQKWETAFTLSQDGGQRFERFTEANIGNRLAVVLDGHIRSVATIQSKISDAGQITNLGSEQEANDLVSILRSGSLPAGLAVVEEH